MSLAKIGNKIFDKEIELSKEQVELNLVDDFDKVFEKALDSWEGTGKTLISSLRKSEVGFDKADAEFKVAIKLGNEATKKAKELGVDLPSTLTNKILSAESLIKEMQKMKGKINALYSAF